MFSVVSTLSQIFTTTLPPNIPLTSSPSIYLYNLSMTNFSDISEVYQSSFDFQYNWNQQIEFSESHPNPAYFNLSSLNDVDY